MPTLTITKTYLNGNILSETDLDNIRNSITTFFNTTGIDSTNVQTGGLLGTNLANNTITQSQLAAGSVGSAQLTSSAVLTQAIGPLAVMTPQIALNAVGPNQLALRTSSTGAVSIGGIAISNTVGTYVNSTTTPTTVTNLSVTITTAGRPVKLALRQDGSASQSLIGATNSSNSGLAAISFLNGATVLCTMLAGTTGPATSIQVVFAPGSFEFLDLTVNGTPGTYTYTVNAALSSGSVGSVNINNVILVAYEI